MIIFSSYGRLMISVVLATLMGCGGSSSSPTSTAPSISETEKMEMKENNRLSSVTLIAELVREKTGATTTLVADYDEALTYVSAPHLSTTKDALERSLLKMVATTKEWMSTLTNIAARDTSLVAQGRMNPPLSLMRFFAFCRILRNAAHVKDDLSCQSKMITDAHNILAGGKFFVDYNVAFRTAVEQCNVMKLDDTDCDQYAFNSELTRLMIQYFYESMYGQPISALSSNTVNFLSYRPTSDFTHCPTEEKKQDYVAEYTHSHKLLSQSLEPPPEGMCVEEHVQNLFHRFKDEMHLGLLNCPHK